MASLWRILNWQRTRGYDRHVGGTGIAMREGFGDLGIGTQGMRTLVEQARMLSLRVLDFSAFEWNKHVIHVFEKVSLVHVRASSESFSGKTGM